MTRLMTLFLPALLAVAVLPIVTIAKAEEAGTAKAERWYKVELLVFSNESSAAASAEQWPATPPLSYPEQVRFLVDEALYANRERDYKASSRIDQSGRQLLSADRSSAAAQPMDADETASGGQPQLPKPFVTLPAEQREFADKAARMRRGGRYAVQFHEAWVQPVPAESTAVPISLDRSGDTLEWPRLQGTVKLHLSRYLHIKTNLWLNTQGNYLPGGWKMPAPPFAPASLLGDELPGFEERKLAMAEARGALTPPPPVQVVAPASASDVPPGVPTPGMPTGLAPVGSGEGTATASAAAPGQPQELAPRYPFRHAVLARQSRKMRSNEIHYLDHPMLGVIVKLTPLAEEDLELLAQP